MAEGGITGDRPMEEPALPGRRRIVVLREAERDHAGYAARELSEDPETWLIDYDEALRDPSPSPVVDALIRRNMFRPGEIFLLSPYEDRYVRVHDAEESFALRKYELFTALCSVLGAREVYVKHIDIDESEQSRRANVSAKYKASPGEAEVSEKLRNKLQKRISMSTRFSGGKPDVEAALHLLEAHNLHDDSTMRGLVTLFQHGNNSVRFQELTLNVTSEASRELKAVAQLRIPAVLTVASTLQSIDSNLQELLLELRVDF